MDNKNKIVYCYGTISNVDNQMPWGTSREYFKRGVPLDRDQMVNTWWAKVNKYEFIKELIYINSLTDKEYIEISTYQIGTHFEIVTILDNYSKWLDKNPCPIKLFNVNNNHYFHRTEILALTESQLILKSGDKVPFNLLNLYKYEDCNKLSIFCKEWNIKEECTGLYMVII